MPRCQCRNPMGPSPNARMSRSVPRGSPRTKIRGESSSNARKLRSAGFTPQKIRAKLSSNVCLLKLRGAGLTPHFHAELPTNGYSQWMPSMESFREHEEFRLFPISFVVPFLRPLPPRSSPTIRGRWYRSAASAWVQPRNPFPSFWTWLFASTSHSWVMACW